MGLRGFILSLEHGTKELKQTQKQTRTLTVKGRESRYFNCCFPENVNSTMKSYQYYGRTTVRLS